MTLAGLCCDYVYIDVGSPSGYHVLLQWEMSGTVLVLAACKLAKIHRGQCHAVNLPGWSTCTCRQTVCGGCGLTYSVDTGTNASSQTTLIMHKECLAQVRTSQFPDFGKAR